MAKKATTNTKDTKDTKVMTPEEMTKVIRGLVKEVAELKVALAQAQATPAQETKSKSTKKSTKSTKSTKDSKPRKPAPTKEQWLAFKQENADKVAHLKTRHERNSALYKLYMAA